MLSCDLLNLVHHLEGRRTHLGYLVLDIKDVQDLNAVLCAAAERVLELEKALVPSRLQYTETMLKAENVIPFQRPSSDTKTEGGTP